MRLMWGHWLGNMPAPLELYMDCGRSMSKGGNGCSRTTPPLHGGGREAAGGLDLAGGDGRKTAPETATPFSATKTTTLSGSSSGRWLMQGGRARDRLGMCQWAQEQGQLSGVRSARRKGRCASAAATAAAASARRWETSSAILQATSAGDK
jgi:hypothetical protein